MNNRREIIIVILLVIICLFIYIFYINNSSQKIFSNSNIENTVPEVLLNNQIHTQTQNEVNNPNALIINSDDLLKRNGYTKCGNKLPDEGKSVMVSGYAYVSDLEEVINLKRDGSVNNGFNLRGGRDMALGTVGVGIDSIREKAINELINNYNKSGDFFTKLLLVGKVQGFDAPIMGQCLVGVNIIASDLSVIK